MILVLRMAPGLPAKGTSVWKLTLSLQGGSGNGLLRTSGEGLGFLLGPAFELACEARDTKHRHSY